MDAGFSEPRPAPAASGARPSAPAARRRRLFRILAEAAAGAVALALSGIAVAHVVAGPGVHLLFYDGDSLLLPLMRESIGSGHPGQWALSSAVFAFPELPVYLAISAFVHDPRVALLVNAFVNLLALYVLLRVLAGLVIPRRRMLRTLAAAIAAFALVVMFIALETDPSPDNGELVSRFLTTADFYGSALTIFGLTALLVLGLRGRPGPGDPRGADRGASSATSGEAATARARTSAETWRFALIHGGALLLAGLSVWSNPVTVLWAVLPLGVALGVGAALRRGDGRRILTLLAAVLLGTAIGLLARGLLGSFLFQRIRDQLRVTDAAASARFYAHAVATLAGTPTGAIELGLLALLFVLSCFAAVAAARARESVELQFLATAAVVGPILVIAGAIVTGTSSTRYLLPVYLFPLLGVIALARLGMSAARRSVRVRPAVASVGVVAIVVAGVVTLGGAGAFAATVPPIAHAMDGPYSPAACVEDWIGDRDVEGAGDYDTVRALSVYGGPSVHLLQLNSELGAYSWQNDVTEFEDPRVSFVLVSATSPTLTADTVTAALGQPADVTFCPGLLIYDYAQPEAALDAGIVDTAADELRLHVPGADEIGLRAR